MMVMNPYLQEEEVLTGVILLLKEIRDSQAPYSKVIK